VKVNVALDILTLGAIVEGSAISFRVCVREVIATWTFVYAERRAPQEHCARAIVTAVRTFLDKKTVSSSAVFFSCSAANWLVTLISLRHCTLDRICQVKISRHQNYPTISREEGHENHPARRRRSRGLTQRVRFRPSAPRNRSGTRSDEFWPPRADHGHGHKVTCAGGSKFRRDIGNSYGTGTGNSLSDGNTGIQANK